MLFRSLLIVGDGFLIPDLKQLANELGISANVHFTGSVSKENVYQYMAAMDILTLPNTEWYCSPVKLFEYGALGKPILAVKEAGVSDVMTSEQGVLFDNNDQSFEEALEYAVENLSLLDQKAKAFQRKILQQHSWRANAANILQHLNSQS